MLSAVFSSSGYKYAEGMRAGFITEFSEVGWVYKTMEGSIRSHPRPDMGFMKAQGFIDCVGEFKFSVDKGDEKLIPIIKEAIATGAFAVLKFEKREYFLSWLHGEERIFAKSVELLPKQPEPVHKTVFITP